MTIGIFLGIVFFIMGQELAVIFVLVLGISVVLPFRARYSVVAGAIFFTVSIRTLDLHRWLVDITLFEQQVFGVIMRSAPSVADNASIVLLVHPNNTYVLEHINNSLMMESALRTLYENTTLTARICYLSPEPWGWYDERCWFAEEGVYTTFADSTTLLSLYEQVIIFEYTSNGDTIPLEQIPSDVLWHFDVKL